jgi:2,4-dienoyl-CoA reductase-like NADH-dependent reductase (Old Yellow Enzyme family)/thioredoxin reductase
MNVVYPSIFSEGKIGTLTLPNRLVMAPVDTNFADYEGKVSEKMLAYYEMRARGGVGMIIVENSQVEGARGKHTVRQLCVSEDRFIAGLKRLAFAIHKHQVAAVLQLHHAGRQTTKEFTGGLQPVAPSAIPCKHLKEPPRALMPDEIEEIENRFARAAVRAKTAGFDGIELHGAHGYLIGQFMSPYTNHRDDAYGRDFEGRMQFPIRIIEKIRDAVGEDYPILFRLSADEFVDGGITLEESKRIAVCLEEAGVDALHVSAGIYESLMTILEPMSYDEGWRVYLAREIKKLVSTPVITVGNIRYPETVEGILSRGDADFVAMGRALIADPEWPLKVKEGRTKEIRYCISCNEGCLGNRLTDYIGCSINPEVGRENRLGKKKKPAMPRHITVVGAGPAGITAALQADKMGHHVVLFERNPWVGGQLRLFASMPTKHRINDLLNFFEYQLEKSNIDVRLGTEFDPQNPGTPLDVVVIATGSIPSIPILPGIKDERIITPVQCLDGQCPKGSEDVLVVGGGVTGCELALFLKSLNNRVILIEKEDRLAGDLEEISRMDLLRRMAREKLQVFLKMSLREITEEGAILADHEGKKFMVRPTKIVLAMGNHAQAILRRRLKGKANRLFVIGDAKEPRTIYYAIHDAYKAVLSIT